MAGPGYGKSTFSANFQLLYNSRIPAIHFVEWGKPHHYDPSTILRNLAFQLAVRYPEYRKILLAMPKDTLPQLKYKSEDELFQILFCDNTWCVIDGGRENAWILMDALDEASDENGNKIAETVARHLDQMPSWIRFIITSRHDPYVKNVFKRFHPQVLDIEKNASDHNLEDMSMYLNAEMNGTDVSDGVKNELLKKSNGVFLYLKLCVEAYKAGELDLSGNSELPNSLSDFYYLTFMRIFRDRIEHYRNRVLPILEVMVGSKEAVSIPFAQYCSELRNDYDFFDALREIEIICRMGRQKDDTVRTISFFHQSLKDWLLNHDSSGPFYVSLVQAEKRISRCLSRWLVSEDKNDSSYWSINGFGICHLKGIDIDRIGSISQKKVHLIMDSIHIDCAFGGMLKTHNYEVNILLDYVDSMAHNKSNTTSVLEFLNALFESVKDKYIIANVVSKETRRFDWMEMSESVEPKKVWDAVKSGAIIGIIGHHVSIHRKSYPSLFIKVLKEKLDIL